jgi:lipopolysaccharide transport system ATP-binding protein
MSNTVITVENLSKRYRIGVREEGYKTFREAVVDAVKAPIRNLQRLHRLSKFDSDQEGRKGPSDLIWALKDVSFETKEGEVLGIIGRNGSGKSTLLKIISRITEPTAGDVKIYGRTSSLLEVGTGFHPELTGRENIYLNAAILGMRKTEIERKFDEIVAFAEIEKFMDTPVKHYSSGMYVRLAFAVAAHLEPEILLVDEVLAVGDIQFQKKCLGKMEDVASEGRTIVFVSHNMTAMATLCSRVLYLSEGRRVFLGSVEEGIDRYLAEMSEPIASDGNIEHTDRRYGPSSFSRLLSIQTLDGRFNVTDRFEMGSMLKVRIGFRLTEHIRNLEVGWTVFSSTGAKLQTFVGNWEGMPTDYSAGTHCVVCEVPSVILFPGIFRITPWVKREGEHVDDQVPMATEFEVVGANITGHNQYFERYPHSGVFQRTKWYPEINPPRCR